MDLPPRPHRGRPTGSVRVSPIGSADRRCDDASMAQTLVVVDDDPGFRSLIRRLLNVSGFDVVGDAGDGCEALRLTRRLRPDIVLLDIQMPGPDGFSVARELLREPRPPAVVLTSGRSAEDYGDRITGCTGVAGFLPKDQLSGVLLQELIEGRS